jgi:hypothetical protein
VQERINSFVHRNRYTIALGVGVIVAAAVTYKALTFDVTLSPPVIPADADVETAVLLAQIEQNRVFQEQLLLTVYWALGVLVTLAVVLVTFGWFTNTQIRERDRDALKQEVRDTVTTRMLEAAQESQKEIATRLDSIEKRLSSNIGQRLGSITRQLREVELKAILLEREKWVQRKVPENALMSDVEQVEKSTAYRIQWAISQGLSNMTETLGQLEGSRLLGYDIESITSALNKVPPDHHLQVEAIREMVRTSLRQS